MRRVWPVRPTLAAAALAAPLAANPPPGALATSRAATAAALPPRGLRLDATRQRLERVHGQLRPRQQR